MDAAPSPPGPAAAPPRRRRRFLLWLATALLLLVAAVLGALGWLLMGYPNRPGPGRGRVVELPISPTDGLEDVAAGLARKGALAEPRLFVAYATVRGARERLRRGRVLLYDDMQPRELLQRIARGYGSPDLRIVIPEGFTRFEIAGRLERWGVCAGAEFLRASEDRTLLRELSIEGKSAEGLLFPDTYLLREGMPAPSVVRRLVGNARRRMAELLAAHELELQRLRTELGWGTHEVLTLASIVEKEARLAHEQPIIAGVFLNRMRDPQFKPKRLQADPTVSYGCLVAPELPSCAGSAERLTRAMLQDPDNPYNTYRHDGLPPGPIANPGLSALRAVLSPAAHAYLYFVARGGGAHTFSETLGDHNLAIQQLRAGPP